MGWIEDIIGLVGGPIGSTVMGAVNDVGQGVAQTGATLANQARFDEGAGRLSNLTDVSQTNMETMQRDVIGGYQRNVDSGGLALGSAAQAFNTGQQNIEQSMVGQSAGLRDTINRGFRDRGTRAMGIISGTGEQERRNINEDFQSFENRAAQDTTSRGLSGTTVQSGVRRGVQRERGRALGNLEERIRQQQVGTFMQTSGDTLNAASQMGLQHIDRSTGLAQNRVSGAFDTAGQLYNQQQSRLGSLLSADERLGTNVELSRQNLVGNQVNWLGARNDTGPNEALFQQNQRGLGAGTVQPPKAPKDTSVLGATIGAGGSIAGAATVATILVTGICVDADAIIMCEGGDKPLRDVRAGDVVIGISGESKVLFVDLCPPHDDRPFEYMRMELDDGTVLRATRDHTVAGYTMGTWAVGDSCSGKRILSIECVDPFEAGDMLLEDPVGYYANGIDVASMLNDHGYTLEQMEVRKAAYEARLAGV